MLDKFLTRTHNRPCELPFPPASHLEAKMMTKQIRNVQKNSDIRGAGEESAPGGETCQPRAAFTCTWGTCHNVVAMQRLNYHHEVSGSPVGWCDIIWGCPHLDRYTSAVFHTQTLLSHTLPLCLTPPLASLTIHNQEKEKQTSRNNHTPGWNKNIWGCCSAGNAVFEPWMCSFGEHYC